MVVAIAVALAASTWMVLELSYEHGNLNLRGTVSREAPYRYVEGLLRYPSELHLWGWVNMGLGAAIMLGLTVARWHYAWWPLHPLGYPVGPTWIMDHLWFNMFLAWFIKVLVLKYGGADRYHQTRPFFMGLILGQLLPGGIFLGHRPFHRHGRQCDFLGVNSVATASDGVGAVREPPLQIYLALWLGVLLQTPCYGDVSTLRATIEALSGVESRLAGYPGAEAGAALVERELVAAGVEAVRRDSFAVVVPIERGGRLQLAASGEQFPLWGLWPNLARTVTLPPEGLQAPMIYGGRGEWSDFDGSAMDGRIVLLEFDSWNHWLRAASLGARAGTIYRA